MASMHWIWSLCTIKRFTWLLRTKFLYLLRNNLIWNKQFHLPIFSNALFLTLSLSFPPPPSLFSLSLSLSLSLFLSLSLSIYLSLSVSLSPSPSLSVSLSLSLSPSLSISLSVILSLSLAILPLFLTPSPYCTPHPLSVYISKDVSLFRVLSAIHVFISRKLTSPVQPMFCYSSVTCPIFCHYP